MLRIEEGEPGSVVVAHNDEVEGHYLGQDDGAASHHSKLFQHDAPGTLFTAPNPSSKQVDILTPSSTTTIDDAKSAQHALRSATPSPPLISSGDFSFSDLFLYPYSSDSTHPTSNSGSPSGEIALISCKDSSFGFDLLNPHPTSPPLRHLQGPSPHIHQSGAEHTQNVKQQSIPGRALPPSSSSQPIPIPPPRTPLLPRGRKRTLMSPFTSPPPVLASPALQSFDLMSFDSGFGVEEGSLDIGYTLASSQALPAHLLVPRRHSSLLQRAFTTLSPRPTKVRRAQNCNLISPFPSPPPLALHPFDLMSFDSRYSVEESSLDMGYMLASSQALPAHMPGPRRRSSSLLQQAFTAPSPRLAKLRRLDAIRTHKKK
jgi:hypothetical protein